MTIFSYDNHKNTHIAVTRQPTKQPSGYQKRAWWERKTKKEEIVMFLSPWYNFSGQEWTLAQVTSCYGTWHAATYVPAHKQHQHAVCNLLQKQMRSKNILLSKQVV